MFKNKNTSSFKKKPVTIQQDNFYPLSIESLLIKKYPGSKIFIDKEIPPGLNYTQYLSHYFSGGLKINALLTIPKSQDNNQKFPAIVFIHGYIPPREYQTTTRYTAYIDYLAKNGFVVFKIDLRGHGQSQGEPSSAYGDDTYTIDVLNAIASLRQYPKVNKDKIGIWAHSMGGYLALRAIVVDKNIKATSIWAGVVTSHIDLINNWRRKRISPPPGLPTQALSWRQRLIEKYGQPTSNNSFWRSISANFYLDKVDTAIQLHHSKTDVEVPYQFSENLARQLKKLKKDYQLYLYENDDHNISKNFDLAMKRTMDFFNQYLNN